MGLIKGSTHLLSSLDIEMTNVTLQMFYPTFYILCAILPDENLPPVHWHIRLAFHIVNTNTLQGCKSVSPETHRG